MLLSIDKRKSGNDGSEVLRDVMRLDKDSAIIIEKDDFAFDEKLPFA